ncbi:hypothetical protein E1A91_D08G294600v1 [Gossypium mustelinum]|uniref:Profilin n=3 Tax=Gossypium TaxID=3633 RepID=A0ABM3AJG8_GOSHI|nr:profilin [Gossypium raimondii]XP_040954953.1 profilin-like [Gossypium hirsutum]KJB27177.1 hypothetical protein B456_004G282500 [Gossypium raimondii]TYI71434.1 hypothetical protein E1A91_D08G294600v1 [Gossypium mustelinum]
MQNPTKQKMSWQTYVDEHLMCDIEGQDQHLKAPSSLRFCSYLQLNASEVTKILMNRATLLLKGYILPLQSIWSYRVSLVLSFVEKKGTGGVTIKKTGQGLIFGIYEEPVTPGQCNMVVERLGDYLAEQGL